MSAIAYQNQSKAANTVTDIQQSLLDAMAKVGQGSVEKANYAYTVKGTIVSLEDPSVNLYKISYGSNTFNAYASAGMVFDEGDLVYILVPDGDFSQEKMILGSTAPRADMYVSNDHAGELYIPKTENLIGINADDNLIKLSTYTTDTKNIPISNIDTFKQIIGDYFNSNNKFFRFTAKVKTDIEPNHQSLGNYGLILTLPFKQKGENGIWENHPQQYVMDVNSMQGRVYDFRDWATQELLFEIPSDMVYDSSQESEISIQAFVEDFAPYTIIPDPIPADIFIKDIDFKIVDVLTELQLEGYYLSLVSSNGNFFLQGEKEYTQKTLTPIVISKGKQVTNFKGWECYWFVEDNSIKTNSENYLAIGGIGWKNLNKHINEAYNQQGELIYDLKTDDYSYVVSASEVKNTLRYKCVMIQNKVSVSGAISIVNYNKTIPIDLVSATGKNSFLAGVGYVDLIARMKKGEGTKEYTEKKNNAFFTVEWQRYDKKGAYIDSDFYEVVKDINDSDGNEIYFEQEIRYPCSKLEVANRVQCTFYCNYIENGISKKDNLGSATILVTASNENGFNLIITGADVVYKYDSDGDSPMSGKYDGPISSKIKYTTPFSYKMYKSDGTELTEEEYLYCNFKWTIPENSLIKLWEDPPQNLEGYGQTNIRYDIADKYNKTKALNNTIYLNVEFKGDVYTAVAIPVFMKDGEGGTNGTNYSALIEYADNPSLKNYYAYGEKDDQGKTHKFQAVWVCGENKWYAFESAIRSLVPIASNNQPQFKTKLYCDGTPVSDDLYKVEWSMFDPGINTSIQYNDTSKVAPKSFNINASSETETFIGKLSIKDNVPSWTDNINNIYCNIIQAKITVPKNSSNTDLAPTVIYAYYPIEVIRLLSKDSGQGTGTIPYIPTIKGGFDEVVYSSDGKNPQYDNSEVFSCDDDFNTPSIKKNYEYIWAFQTANLEENNYNSDSLERHQKNIRPKSNFESGNSNNYVKVRLDLTQEEKQVIVNKITEDEGIEQGWTNKRDNYERDRDYFLNKVGDFNYDVFNNELKKVDKQQGIDNISFLSKRYEGLGYLDTSLKLIHQILIFSKTALDSFNESTYTEVENSIKEAKDFLLKSLSTNLSPTDTEPGKIFPKLTKIVYTPRQKDELNSFGAGKAQRALNLTDSLNDNIEAYNNRVNNLEIKAIKFYNSFYKKLENWRALLFDKSLEDYEEVIIIGNLRNNISGIINTLSSCYSYSEIDKNILQAINDLVKIYLNKNYVNNFINEKKNNCQKEIDKLQSEINGLKNSLIEENSNLLVIIKPIVMTFNRYGLSFLNGWDGNKIYTGDEDKFLIAPMVGAGEYNPKTNLFTGITIGKENAGSSSDYKIGLLGYSDGAQSIFLNAKDGSAIFGKSGMGQIIIDPTKSKGLLYSSNYWEAYNKDGKPSNYKPSGEGTCIDLSNGILHFANAEGKIYSGQHDALNSNKQGFYLSHNGLSVSSISGDKEIARIELSTSGQPKIFSNQKSSLSSGNDGFYLGNDGLSIGSKVYISNNGLMKLGSRAVGTSDSTCWTISGDVQKDSTGRIISEESYIKYNNSGATNSVYISTSKITLGKNFYADDTGLVRVGAEAVSNSSKHWTIAGIVNSDDNKSYSYIGYGTSSSHVSTSNNEVSIDSSAETNSVYLGTDAIRLGKKFAVDNAGNLLATNVKATGYINAKEGKIGNWTIENKKIVGIYNTAEGEVQGRIELNAEGSILGGKVANDANSFQWKINRNGKAIFKDIEVTGGSITLGNTKIDATNINSTSFDFDGGGSKWSTGTGGCFSGGGKAVYGADAGHNPFTGGSVTHIESLALNKLTAEWIDGKYIKAGLLTADNIKTGHLTADRVSAGKVNEHNVSWQSLAVFNGFDSSKTITVRLANGGEEKIIVYSNPKYQHPYTLCAAEE